jgi:hypothetical protein
MRMKQGTTAHTVAMNFARARARLRHRARRMTGRPDIMLAHRGLSDHAKDRIRAGTAFQFTPGRGRFTQPRTEQPQLSAYARAHLRSEDSPKRRRAYRGDPPANLTVKRGDRPHA